METDVEKIEKLLGLWIPAVIWEPHPTYLNCWKAFYNYRYYIQVRERHLTRSSHSKIYEWVVEDVLRKNTIATSTNIELARAQLIALTTLGKILTNGE